MKPPLLNLPTDYLRIKVVSSFEELVATPMVEGVNALCWARSLDGDFDEVVARIGPVDEITGLDEEDLEGLALSANGEIARGRLIEDLRLLKDAGLAPNLDCIPHYPKEADPGPVPTDVYSWHADSATVMADTFLCSYAGTASEGLRNEEAVRKVDIPEIRRQLLQIHGGKDDEAFKAYLHERCFDRHYAAGKEVKPIGFGLGNLWRIATECPGRSVPPCIHRAPITEDGQAPRLLLIS